MMAMKGDKKSNKITAIPKLIATLDITSYIIIIDVM